MHDRTLDLYFADIADSGKAILEYTEGLTFEDFSQDRKTFSAVIREFEIIGEAVGKIPENIRKDYQNVEWQDIKDFRNLLIHEYFGIDLEIVWKIIQDDLPILLRAIHEILAKRDINV
ncbi:MAG: DUF86 domain-containing protein [Desulfobacteraceae bacterium]|nr:MAG: DUF86 domain-containing protein [Desulfobacteraceae bacterium]